MLTLPIKMLSGRYRHQINLKRQQTSARYLTEVMPEMTREKKKKALFGSGVQWRRIKLLFHRISCFHAVGTDTVLCFCSLQCRKLSVVVLHYELVEYKKCLFLYNRTFVVMRCVVSNRTMTKR
jgi:hypothetical protein